MGARTLLAAAAAALSACAVGARDAAAVAGWAAEAQRLMAVEPPSAAFPGGGYFLAFSPHVDGFRPGEGPEPPPELIGQLMDGLIADAASRGVHLKGLLSYGTTGANGHVPGLAQARGLKVVQNIWLEAPEPGSPAAEAAAAANAAETAAGIELGRAYPDTVIALSCGSEVRLRSNHVLAAPVILACVDALKAADVPQPIASQMTWPEACDEETPGALFPACQRWVPVGDAVDMLLVTAYAYWENHVTGRYAECFTTPDAIAAFHVDRLAKVAETYPGKPVVLSEFGWPAADAPTPDAGAAAKCGDTPAFLSTEMRAGVAAATLARCAAAGASCIPFTSHEEPWKAAAEGGMATRWGFCAGVAPYACTLPTVPAPAA